MANRGLGTLTLSLVAGIGGFTGPMDAAARNADKNFRKISDSASKFGKALGAGIATAAIAATTALIGITKAAIDNADAIRDLSIRTGIGTETLSAYGYAASQTGTSVEALAKGLNLFAKNVVAAGNPTSSQAKIFDALGLSVTDAAGNIKKMEVLLPEFATKFKGLEEGATKTALVLKLFGKSGAELKEFLNQGGVGLDEFTAKARELGLVVDQDTADAADKFKDTLGEVKASVGGLGLSIARELLPSLQSGAEDFRDLVKEGDLAHNMVTLLSTALSIGVGALDTYNTAVKKTGVIMDFMTQAGLGWQESVRNIWAPWSDGTVANGIAQMRKAMADGDKALADINNPKAPSPYSQSFTPSKAGSAYQDELKKFNNPEMAELERRLAAALANPKSGGGAKKTGKSDADKEAEALLKAYQSMEASYREQIALVGDVTEVERLRYELVNGEGKKFTEEQKATLLGLAAQKDAVDAANKVTEETKQLIDSLITPTEEINKRRERAKELLDQNKISQEQYNRVLSDSLTPAEQMLEDLAFETELLGKTREEQDLMTEARLLGAEAMTAQGKAALESFRNFQAESKATAEQVAVMDDIRDGFGDFFSTIIDGSASASDAFKSLVDDILASLTRWASNKLVEQFLGSYGSTQSGSSAGGGFDWGALIGAIFGGGKAGGGGVSPGMFYRVNENGPEMLSVGGQDYLMMGSQGGTVTPNQGGSGGPLTVIFNNPVMTDRRSAGQHGQEAAQKLRQAARNN